MTVFVTARALLGAGSIPSSKPACLAWLKRLGVQAKLSGNTHLFALSDLPAPERLAYIERSIAAQGLPLGRYDDAAHEAFMQAPASMRERAERNAAMVQLLVSLGQRVGWPDRLSLLQRKFGVNCPSKGTLKRYLRAIKGIDPINYAPALLAGYKGKVATAEISDKAWQFFVTTIRDAAPEFPLIQAWRATWGARKAGHGRLGVPNGRDLMGARRRIAEEIGAEGLLIVDEAQHLVQRSSRGRDNWDALEWLRAMAEEGCFSLVFCGDIGLQETANRLPQLWRRMRRRVIIKSVTKSDAETLCLSRGVSDAAVITVLFQIARRGGGLGDVGNVTRIAQLFAGSDHPTLAHLKAAIIDLNLAPKGGS